MNKTIELNNNQAWAILDSYINSACPTPDSREWHAVDVDIGSDADTDLTLTVKFSMRRLPRPYAVSSTGGQTPREANYYFVLPDGSWEPCKYEDIFDADGNRRGA
jgi:hypothetical protein